MLNAEYLNPESEFSCPNIRVHDVRSVQNVMRTLAIKEIGLDGEGGLLVLPDLRGQDDFAFIYRAGVEIRWRPTERALMSPAPRPDGWSYSDWFRQILRAVAGEYGTTLVIDGNTIWSVPEEVRRQIEATTG